MAVVRTFVLAHDQATGTDDAAAFEAGVAASMAEAGLKPKVEPRGRRPSLGVVK